MEFNLVKANLSQVLLDVPYRDGARNIKAAFKKNPTTVKVDAAATQATKNQQHTSKISLKERVAKFVVGVTLCIPIVNIAIDYAIRRLQIKPNVTSTVERPKTDFITYLFLSGLGPSKKNRQKMMDAITPELKGALGKLGFDPEKATFNYTFRPMKTETYLDISIKADGKEFKLSGLTRGIGVFRGQLFCKALRESDPQTIEWNNGIKFSLFNKSAAINLLQGSPHQKGKDYLDDLITTKVIPEIQRILTNLGHPQATLTYERTTEPSYHSGQSLFDQASLINFNLRLGPNNVRTVHVRIASDKRTGLTDLTHYAMMEKLIGEFIPA